MKECNFAGQMEMVSRILFFVALLVLTSPCGAAETAMHKNGEDFSVFEENGKVGLKNQRGDILIPAEYEAMGWSNGTFSIIDNVTGYQSNGFWGLINISNSRVTKPQYVDLSPGEGTLIVGRRKKAGSVRIVAGCVNTSGKEVIPFEYDGLRTSSFRAIVYVRNGVHFNHGLIDYQNNVLIPLAYQNIYPLGSLRYGVENFENKTAIFSEDGKQITPFLIDSLSEFRKNMAIIYQGHHQGVIDREGQIRVDPVYREVTIGDNGAVSVRQPDEWVFLSGNNDMLRSYRADSVVVVTPDLLKVRINKQVWFARPDFSPLNDLSFSSIGHFCDGRAVVSMGDGCGVVNSRGEMVITPEYSRIAVDGNFTRAEKMMYGRNRWILLNGAGDIISQHNYDSIAPFNGVFFPVINRGYWGAIDTTGREIIACVHDSFLMHDNERVVVKFKGQFGIIGTDESWIVTPQPEQLEILNDSLYLVRSPTTTFLKSMKGELIYFSDNELKVAGDHFLEQLPSGGLWKIDFTGVILDRGTLSDGVEHVSGIASEGLRAIKSDGRFGFIDSESRLRIANRYENVMDFSEGLAAVKIRGRWGFINHADQLAIQPVYDDVGAFRDGIARVRQKDQWGIIDQNGEIVLPLRYEEVTLLPGRRYVFRQGTAWGYGNGGRLFIGTKYDRIQPLENGAFIVARDGKYGLLNQDGVSTIPMTYDGLMYDQHRGEYIALKKSEWKTLRL